MSDDDGKIVVLPNRSSGRTVTLEFSVEALHDLQKMRQLLGRGSNGEVIRDALRLLSWYVTLRADNARLQRLNADGSTETFELEI